MNSLPPLPPGFRLAAEPEERDPWEILSAEGWVASNGYRTEADVGRIRRQGYTPARHGAHNRADGVDLDHPGLTPGQQVARLRELFGDWRGMRLLDEGHHRHLELPGWGAAPGTPGTRNFGLPDLPEGFTLVQRGALTPDNFMLGQGSDSPPEAPQPPRSAVEAPEPPPAPPRALPRPAASAPAGAGRVEVLPHDPAGTHVATAPNPEALRDALGQLQALFDRGAPRSEVIALARRLRVPEASPHFMTDLANAYRLRARDPRASVRFVPGEVRRVRPDQPDAGAAEPGTRPETAEEWNRRRIEEAGASISAHRPDFAERIGDRLSGVLEPVVGRYSAVEAGNNLESLLEWTSVGDVDAARQYEAARQRALLEGRWLDAAGNQLGRDVSAAAIIPIVGPAIGRVRRGAARLFGRGGREALEGSASPAAMAAGGAGAPPPPVPAPSFGRLEEFRREGNERFLSYTAPDGQQASIHVELRDNGLAEISVDPFSTAPNRFGAAAIRDAMQQLRRMYPEIRGVEGVRESGAMPGRNQRIDFAPPSPAAAALPDRQVDRIDVDALPPLPPGFTLEPRIGRVAPLGEQPDPADMAAVVRSIRPEDVLPIPDSRVATLEAARRVPGSISDLPTPPQPESVMPVRTYRRRDGRDVRYRGPLDAEGFLRLNGGVRDYRGELAHIGLDNRARREAPGERRLGPLVNPQGLSLDEAGEALWEAGYFAERPAVADVLDVLRSGRIGSRTWRPEDVDEVADFAAAQRARLAADDAEHEGRPFAERVGEAVTAADLDAMEPPATAYEDLPSLGGHVGGINLAHVESAHDIRRLLQNVETRFGGFDAARRGRITHAETRALANELGLTPDDLMRRRRGQALNAEQALAARQLLAKSSDEVIRLAERATGLEASDASRLAFSEALVRHAAIHEQVTAARAEAGRALSAQRAAARSGDVSGRIHQAVIAGMGGQERLEEIAEKILDLQRQGAEPGKINRFAVDAQRPRLRDKLVELWYNWLLSGPQTHAVNVLSNAMTATLQIPEQAVAAGIGYARRAVRAARGQPDDFDRVLFSELGPRTVGLFQGAREGLRAAGRTFLTGEVSDYVTKVESASQRAIGGVMGSVIRTPTRALAAEDEFFKAVARRMELNALAVRKARSEGLRGQAARDRIAELSANPPPEMLERVLDYGRYLTFQRPLEGFPADVARWANRQPAIKLFLPFIRTPTNLFKYAVERSPFAPVLRQVRADWAAGGERRAVAAARMAVGTGLGLLITQWVSDGAITGAPPEDRSERDLLYASGWQPYSIRIGDTYYSYQRLDPLAMTLGAAADLRNLGTAVRRGEADRLGAQFIASVIGNLSNKTWLSGVSDLVEVLDPSGGPALRESRLNNFVARLAGSIAVPTGVAQIARTADPLQRDTRGEGLFETAWNRIKSRLPGVSRSLPARRDVWGRELRQEGGLGPDIASPIWTRAARSDPVTGELLRLGAGLGRPARSLTIDGERRRLTPDEYGRYQGLAGRYIRDDLSEAMADPEWRDSDDAERRDWVRAIVRDAREDARADLGFYDGEVAMPPPLPPGFQLAQ